MSDANLAPVTPLFGRRPAPEQRWHPTWADDAAEHPSPDPAGDSAGVPAGEAAAGGRPGLAADACSGRDADPSPNAVAQAEERLIRSLRRRSLTLREATRLLRSEGLEADEAAAIIERLERHGALGDTAVAEQIVHQASARKGQGRVAIARELVSRGIDRGIADQVLSGLPDDDEQRARAFADKRARQMTGVDDDTALRRLVGQLARRGFPGSLAMTVARTAITQRHRPEAPAAGPRFSD